VEGSGLIVVEGAYPGILVKGLRRITVVSLQTFKNIETEALIST